MVFSDYSFAIAIVKTADRLTRCSHDLSFYPTSHLYDFVSAVDYPESRTIPDSVIYKMPTIVSSGSIQIKDTLDNAIQFINNLINEQSFSSALLEISRVIFQNPEAIVKKPLLYVNKLKCYEGLKEYSKAILEYESMSFPSILRDNYKVLYTIGHLYDLNGDLNKGISILNKAIDYLPANESVSPYGELALLYAKNNDINSAEEAINKKYLIDQNLDSYEASMRVLETLQVTKVKNPNVAGILSIIPGLGYMYTNQPQNAIAAILINGALAYATYTSIKNKNYGVGGILGILNLSFYIGNISGSHNSAIRYNNTIKRNAINSLREINPYIN